MKRLRVLSLFSGIGGFDLGLERAGMKIIGMVEIDRFRRAVLKTHWPQTPLWDDIKTLTFSLAGSPARTSLLLGSMEDSTPREADSSLSLLDWQRNCGRVGSFSKTSLVSYLRTKVPTSLSSSTRLPNAGMVWRGEFWTAAISESPNDAAECSLSDILEARAHQRFYLSQKAAAGILHRAKNRGRTLPTLLLQALRAVADSIPTENPTSSKTEVGAATQVMSLRRLTPTECERLQDFPDGWTLPDMGLWGMR